MGMLKVGRPDDDKDNFVSHYTVMYYVVEHDNNGKLKYTDDEVFSR